MLKNICVRICAISENWQWTVFLPTLGVLITAILIIFVNSTVPRKVNRLESDFEKFRVRTPAEKKDEKAKANPAAGMVGVSPPIELGSTQEVINRFDARSNSLDVRTRIYSYMTVWSVANFVQFALSIAVIALALRLVWLYWDTWKLPSCSVAVMALLLLISGIGIGVADWQGWAPVSPNDSVSGKLQTAVKNQIGYSSEFEFLTVAGLVLIVLVQLLVPISLGCVLSDTEKDPNERFQQYQQLLYLNALLMVAGVVQVTIQNRLPILLFDDEFNVHQVGQMAAGMGLRIAAIHSVAMGMVFLPAGFVLQRGVTDAAEPDAAAPSRNWYMEIFAVFAPLLSALPISKLFESVV